MAAATVTATAAAAVVTVALAMMIWVLVVMVAAVVAAAKIVDFSQMSENTNRIAPCVRYLVRNELEHEPAGTFDMLSEHAHL